MKRIILSVLSVFIAISLLTSCASSRSELGMAYKGEVKRNPNTEKVSVFFVFSHLRQMVGFDAIPKLDKKYQIPKGFDDIFLEALREISNLGTYTTYYEESSHVNIPSKRAEKESFMKSHDYTIKIRIEAKKKFSYYFLGYLISTATLTAIPVPYPRMFTIKTEVLDKSNRLMGTYERNATLTNWSQILLVMVYPFHPEFRKVEEIYMAFLSDTFRQIESEGILKK
jgi:hypothetical protein